MKKQLCLLIMLMALITPALCEGEKTASQLLDQILETPGSWHQMCFMMSDDIPREDIPLGGYSRRWGTGRISVENFLILRSKREDVIGDVIDRLELETPKFVSLLETGREDVSDVRLECYLLILADLNAVESLPRLLELESALATRTTYENRAGKYYQYPMHIQTLSTITEILKREKYHAIPYGIAVFNKKMRDTIVGLARTYLAKTEPSDYRAAKGMSARPTER